MLVLWKRVAIYGSQKQHENTLKVLDEIAKADANLTVKVKQRKAGIYFEMKKYSDAIKLYSEVGSPPGSLYSIAECYFRMKNIKSAIRSLTEVENAFPDQAADAALRKVRYYQAVKDKKNSIATSRRILKQYPKSNASSQAHQILEDYGISTGGGVIEE